MHNDTYALLPGTTLVAHYPMRPIVVCDYDTPNADLDARVRSGDYFITLATTLETLAGNLPEVSTSVASLALDRLAKELEYVQRHYAIIKKNRPDPLTEL